VFNRLACWNAYTEVPETDATTFLYGTIRRWDNLFPSTPGGFVPIIPHKQASLIEAHTWSNKAFQTNGDTWTDFSVDAAKEIISSEVLAQRDSLGFYVEGECFWQVTQDKEDSLTYFILLMGNSVLTPVERTVTLKAGNNATKDWKVYDQLSGTPNEAMGIISLASGNVTLSIPAGTPRLLCIQPVLSTGIFQPKNKRLKVYPNPAQQILNIEVKDFENTETPITIYNFLGQEFKHYILQNKRKILDVSSWPPGMYMIQMQNSGKNEIKKVIIN